MKHNHNQSQRYSILVAACCLLMPGCATETAQRSDIQPVFRVESGQQEPFRSIYYENGRQLFARGEYGLAIEAFRMALKEHDRSIMALNGLGACYDKLGRYDVAAGYYFKALEIDPDSGRTLNNIGYSFLLQNKPEVAQVTLHLAAQKMPGNALVRANLKLASLNVTAGEPAIVPVSYSPPEAIAANTTLAADNAQLSPTKVQEAAVQVSARIEAALIEVSNGNGRNGMAKLVGKVLSQRGLIVKRITNAGHFHFGHTIIYFAPGLRTEAEALADTLPVKAELKESADHLYGSTNTRIVLGADFLSFEKSLRDEGRNAI